LKSPVLKTLLLCLPVMISACTSRQEIAITLDDSVWGSPKPRQNASAYDFSEGDVDGDTPQPGALVEGTEKLQRQWPDITFKDADEARRYLAQYPDGIHAAKASSSLQKFETMAWNEARSNDTPDAYRKYIASYGNSQHLSEANSRMEAISNKASSQACKDFMSSDFGAGATPGSFLEQMREQRKVEVCGEGA
jgi:hypothetical protein